MAVQDCVGTSEMGVVHHLLGDPSAGALEWWTHRLSLEGKRGRCGSHHEGVGLRPGLLSPRRTLACILHFVIDMIRG